jgi:hypothetical protein
MISPFQAIEAALWRRNCVWHGAMQHAEQSRAIWGIEALWKVSANMGVALLRIWRVVFEKMPGSPCFDF